MEKLEIFDSLFSAIGSEDRKVVHKEGLWHQTFHCWIVRKRENKVYILFQKRSANKADSPNMLDIPAAGHLLYGEQKEDGLRELEEELGIKVEYNKLKYLGIRVEAIEVPGFNNKEFQHVFLLDDNTSLLDFKLQEDEVCGLVEVELSQGYKLLYGEVESIQCDCVSVENGKKNAGIYNMKLEDIIPRFDGYYKKVFIMAERYFDGYNYLSV